MPPLNSLWLFVILGVLFGVFGSIFNYWINWLLDRVSGLKYPVLLAIVIGAVVGLLVWAEPTLVGAGDGVIDLVLSGQVATSLLLVLFFARFIGGGICFVSGAPGGIFAPMLALGTLLGVWFGNQAAMLFPQLITNPEVFAVAGMGALFAATVRAPLTGIVLALSITANYQLILPMLIACFSATIVAHAFGSRAIYTLLLERILKRQ